MKTGLLITLLILTAATAKADDGFITDVSLDGEIVQLDDGSVYKVDAYDAIDTQFWSPLDDVKVVNDKLVNLDTGEVVDADEVF